MHLMRLAYESYFDKRQKISSPRISFSFITVKLIGPEKGLPLSKIYKINRAVTNFVIVKDYKFL